MPWLPSDSNDRLHLAIVLLHTAGAIGAYLMSTICDVVQATQIGSMPVMIDSPQHDEAFLKAAGISEVEAFKAGFPMAQDATFPGQAWNPYLLVAAFEWLTAGFAMCNLRHWLHHVKGLIMLWLGIGAALAGFWFVRHYLIKRFDGVPFSWYMLAILSVSYAAAILACKMILSCGEKIDASIPAAMVTNPENPEEVIPSIPGTVSPEAYEQQVAKHNQKILKKINVQGRQWVVPQSVSGLVKTPRSSVTKRIWASNTRFRRIGTEVGGSQEETIEKEEYALSLGAYEVGFRYAEYVITAPLLFLAVLSLLTVDAPGWLFLSGYWMIQACIASGIAFHIAFCTDLLRDIDTVASAEVIHPEVVQERKLRVMRSEQQGGEAAPNIQKPTWGEWLQSLLANGSWYVDLFSRTIRGNILIKLTIMSHTGTTGGCSWHISFRCRGSVFSYHSGG